MIYVFLYYINREDFDRGIAQLVEHRSPKPRVVSSNLTAPAKENQGFARNCKPFYSDFFMQNTRTQNQTVSKPSQNGNYRTRQEQMTILYLAFCLLFSKIIRSIFTCFSIRSLIVDTTQAVFRIIFTQTIDKVDKFILRGVGYCRATFLLL